MDKRQNTISIALLSTFALLLISSTGCQMAKFPKMPDMAFWKKDAFRLSRSKDDGVAPPSRTFDPEPSHFAAMDSQSSTNRDTPSTFDSANKNSQPIREPYKIPSDPAATSNDGFGFPSNSKSMLGKNEFSMPDANQFRQAMNGTVDKTKEFAASTQQSVSNVTQNAKDFASNQFKSAGDFAGSGGDFVAQKTQNVLNQSAEIARNVTGQNSNPPKWKTDFELPKPELKNTNELVNQLGNNQFQAQLKQATSEAKNGMSQLNQQAQNQFNRTQQAASNAIQNASQNVNQSINGSLAKATGQFEQSWQNSVEQAKQAAESIQNAGNFNRGQTQTESPSNFQRSQASNQFGSPSNGSGTRQALEPVNQKPSNSFASQNSRAIEVTPQVELSPKQPTTNTQPPATIRNQFATTGAGAFQPSSSTPRQPSVNGSLAPSRTSTPGFQQNPAGQNLANQAQPGNTRNTTPNNQGAYPSTNYSSYGNSGPARVSQVTPIEEPSRPMARQPKPQTPAARTANLPAELLRGNSDYAPGSVKSLSPIK